MPILRTGELWATRIQMRVYVMLAPGLIITCIMIIIMIVIIIMIIMIIIIIIIMIRIMVIMIMSRLLGEGERAVLQLLPSETETCFLASLGAEKTTISLLFQCCCS